MTLGLVLHKEQRSDACVVVDTQEFPVTRVKKKFAILCRSFSLLPFTDFFQAFFLVHIPHITLQTFYMTVSRLESNQIICQQSLNQPNWTRLHLSADAEKEALKTLRITDLKYIPNMQLKLATRCSIHCRQYLRGSILLCKTY